MPAHPRETVYILGKMLMTVLVITITHIYYVHYAYALLFYVGPHYGYYLGFFANHLPSSGVISVLLMTTETSPVEYSIEIPSLRYYYNGTIPSDHVVVLNLSSSVEASSIFHQDRGIYLTTSSNKVSVIGQNHHTATTETYFALPIIELYSTYVYYGVTVPRTSVHSSLYDSAILIVGTQNNTVLKLKVTQAVNVAVGNTVTSLIPRRQYSFVINHLQTMYVRSIQDLTGTKIVTNKPVSVFSGHECANVPWNVAACSHLTEQLPPTALLGKEYYTAPLANRTSYTIKILAAYNSTTVNIYCNNTVESYAINEGEFHNKTMQIKQYCAVRSNKEVLVVQFSHGGDEDNNYGDPMMTLVPATNKYLNKFDFSTIRNPFRQFVHYVNIIVMEQYYQPNMIYLIAGGVNRSLATQQWVPIQVNNTIEAYATQVTIPEGVAQVFHTNSSAQMMTIVYGFSRHDGYGHIGGMYIPKSTTTGC